MKKKTTKKESSEATRASVRKEMAKPRMAKSAREEALKRFAGRITPGKRAKTICNRMSALLPHAR
jgi:hypothetical protein